MKPSDINYEFFLKKCSSKQIKKKLYIRFLKFWDFDQKLDPIFSNNIE